MPTTVTVKKDLPADHRIILDWLCRQPAKVFDFADVADAVKLKRGHVEIVLRDLQHQRFGALLKLKTPDGLPLRSRHAFLPHDSPARAGYPEVAPFEPSGAEHPTVVAMRNAALERAAAQQLVEAQRKKDGEERLRTHATYVRQKDAAREKAAKEKPRRDPASREHTGYSVPSEPLGPSAAAPIAPSTKAPAAPSSVIVKPPAVAAEAPKPVYKKKPANDSPTTEGTKA